MALLYLWAGVPEDEERGASMSAWHLLIAPFANPIAMLRRLAHVTNAVLFPLVDQAVEADAIDADHRPSE